MSLPGIAIRRPVFAWMLMASLILFGVLSFERMGVSLLPDVDFPVVGVSLSLPGAAPAVMESQVVDPIEDAIMQIDGVRSIHSTSQQASASIQIEFDLNRNIDQAVQDVQNHIAQVSNLLPPNMYPPMVRKSNPEDMPILWVAMTYPSNIKRMDAMMYARDYLYNQFATVPGVGDIVLGGYVDPALRVWVDLKKLKALNFTADDVVQAIQTQHVEVPAGRIENKDHEYNVRLMGEAQNPQDFGKIRIQSRGVLGANFNWSTQLKNVATIEEGIEDVYRVSRFNGKPAIGIGIMKQHGSNAVAVSAAIRKRLKEILPNVPPQYTLSIRNDSTRFIKQAVQQLDFTLLMSALLTSLVCFLFLGSWTSTVNVLLAIPTSIIGTFIALYFFGFTLNTFTLLGLCLAIGVVVDDAIMMLENIVRHRELGKSQREAARIGAEEITFAALASSVAVVAIFLPIAFMKGVIGKYLLQFGVTVSVAVLLSLLEALTLTPMRCSRFLQVGGIGGERSQFSLFVDHIFSRLAEGYRRILAFLLRNRWKTVVFTILLFFSSIALVRWIPVEMMPAQDQSMFIVRVKGPVDSALPYTNGKFEKGEKYLASVPEVEGLFSMVGGFGGHETNQGFMFINLVDKNKRKKTQAQIMQEVRKGLKKAMGKKMRVFVQDLSMRGFSSSRGFPVEMKVQGPDWGTLTANARRLIAAMQASKKFTDVNMDIQKGMPEVQIVPDRAKLALHGVSVSSVTTAVNALVGGAILNGQTEYPKNGHRYEIEVRLVPNERERADQLNEVLVRNNRGELIPLSKLVKIQVKPSLTMISRIDRQRAITVYANPARGVSQQFAMQFAKELGKKTLDPGYYVQSTGTSQSFKESLQSLIMALLLGILISYMVLASQFNSFIHPATVLLALPFSFTGAFIGLLLFHQSINVYSLIGLILLMGIVKKNSILLVDFTNQCRIEGAGVHEALLKACPVRLRPILMTSVATIAGALPEALSVGPGSETTVPMAIAIIGGVVVSTILTLFVVPCAYSLFTAVESNKRII